MNPLAPLILIIDDDHQIVQVLTVSLENAGFDVISASDGKAGLRAAYDEHPHLILLDISMPGMNGFQVLDHLRLVTDAPVIMLTSMGSDPNHIRSLNQGAADFLPKGISMDALIAHIQARLRAHVPRTIVSGPRSYDKGLIVDLARHRISLGDKNVVLTPLQWKIFRYLVENEGRIVTCQKLLDVGWESHEFGDERAVKVQISLLRKQLCDSPHPSRYIHTVREEGYMFEVRPNEL